MIEELKVQIDTNLNDCDSEMSQVSNSFKTGECYICLQFIVGKMMICPKGCAPLLCTSCINQMQEDRCPLCKQMVKKSEYVHARATEDLVKKEMESRMQGFCQDHEMDKCYYCITC